MTPPVPARITIEFHSADGQPGWTADARPAGRPHELSAAPVFAAISSEPRHAETTPPVYDAGDCTCHDDFCGLDHDND